MSFTVVVPTIPGRESLLSRCLWSITSQLGDCRVLVMAGEGKLGDKANAAAQIVTTSHMTIVDDDDYLDGAYVESVSAALTDDPDYVGFRLLGMSNGSFMKIGATDGEHRTWETYRKGPTPKGVTRTDIWRDTPMGNRYTADREWHDATARKVKTSVFVDRVLYVYDYWPKGSAFSETTTIARYVGCWPFDRSRIETVTP